MKTMYRVLFALGISFFLSACIPEMTKELKQFNDSLAESRRARTVSGRGRTVAGRGRDRALITVEQRASIQKMLSVRVSDVRLNRAIREASNNIKEYTENLSCQNKRGSSLDIYYAPGRRYRESQGYRTPMYKTRYHNKAYCLDVVRIHGWTMPAYNALRFEVVYLAADSGEAAKSRHEVIKQPDGTWLFYK